MILGKISQITAYDIALTLPNNLTGYIPITAISDQLSEKLERLANRDDEDSDGESEKSAMDEDIDLNRFFSIGQYLRAYVTSTGENSSVNSTFRVKRRIELSVNPRQVNAGLSMEDFIAHSMVQASVVSVEDHGMIMDLGLDDKWVKGFISSEEKGSDYEFDKVQPGAVSMCRVLGLSANQKILKLSADMQKAGDIRKSRYLSDARTVDVIIPGTAVEVLLAEVTHLGISGKVMGMLDVTADVFHSGAITKDIEKTLKSGQRVKGRVICTFPTFEQRRLGVSLLDHICSLSSLKASKGEKMMDPLTALPLSTIVEDATVTKVMGTLGLILDFGVKGVLGFVHIAMISDKRIDSLSESTGPYKIGSKHRARITGYNSMDGVYIASMREQILSQPFLRVEDIKIGELVKGKVEKLVVNEGGVGGILVNLAEGITGLVPEMHIADVKLSHPEKKFKEGMPVTARVLSTNTERKQVRLTLKKSLVNSDAPIIASYENVLPDTRTLGAIVNVLPTGAVVRLYGPVRAFLPVSEMSQTYIEDPSKHFRIGQVVNVRVLSVDPTSQKMTVSCKDPAEFGFEHQSALQNLKLGSIVNGTVIEKSNDDLTIQLEGSRLTAFLSLNHLTDGSERKCQRALREIRVDQILKDLVVWQKNENKGLVLLTNKPSLRAAAMDGKLLTTFEDVREGETVVGIVKNITLSGVFLQFAGGLTGLILKRHLADKSSHLPDFGLQLFQPMTVTVLSINYEQQRFLLTVKEVKKTDAGSVESNDITKFNTTLDVTNPVDPSIRSLEDFSIGKITKARIRSVKRTQVNVQLADNIQGRVDMSEVFDSWEEIIDKKRPLQVKFQADDIISVSILGLHDARNHRFLPITHRAGKNSVFELSAKPSDQISSEPSILTLDKVTVGSTWTAFINNIEDKHVWASLSPSVRGRIALLDLSDEVSLLNDLEKNFPVGSALRVQVTNVDVENNRLDLAALSRSTGAVKWESLSKGMVLPGRITRVADRFITVHLSNDVVGSASLTDLADDYDEATLSNFTKNEIVRVCITELDVLKQKIWFSLRPSKVLNSSLPVRDPEITSLSQLKVQDIVRGFVKNIANEGLFVSVGLNVTGYARITDLSDAFLKDWKSHFQVNQVVEGRVISIDPLLNHLQISLKRSVVDKNWTPPITFTDLKVGQIVTGKIRKVEDFGAFMVVDNSANVSGLCHRSEIAAKRVEDVRKLYQEGDAVKAKVLKIDPEKRRISFGLKASYFQDEEKGDESSDEDEDMEDVVIAEVDEGEMEENDMDGGGVNLNDVQEFDSNIDDNEESLNQTDEPARVVKNPNGKGLQTIGFDWTASVVDLGKDEDTQGSEDGMDETKRKKKKKRRAEIKVDRTGDLDAHGPQSVADFERLLLGQPDSSYLWLQYMAHHLQLSEVDKAREIAERALRTIGITEETEKMNIWIGMLNLENTYGTDELVEQTFKRACQYNDPQEIHERLISIYIQSGKHDVSLLSSFPPHQTKPNKTN